MSPQTTTLLSGGVVLVYLLGIRWLDRYEREPLWSVLFVFVLGGVFSTTTALGLYEIIDIATGGLPLTTHARLVAPFVEEFTKGLALFAAMSTTLAALPFDFFEQIDNETDGLVYGAAVGLGFALVENTMYYRLAAWNPFATAEMVEQLAINRTLLSTIGHSTATALIGMAVGYARYSGNWRTWLGALAEGYGLAVVAHAVNNTVVAEAHTAAEHGDTTGSAPTMLVAMIVGMSVLLFVLTQYALFKEHAMMRRLLADEAGRGTLPAAHADILPYWRRRFGSDWLEEAIPKREYIRLATRLAFRRRQAELVDGPASDLRADIEDLRGRIRDLLAQDPDD